MSVGGVRERNTLRAASLLVLVLLVGVIGGGVPVLAQAERAPQPAAPALSTLVIATQGGRFPFAVELADTPEARIQGLQGRRYLAADRGMLFDFDPPQPVAMWMKDTPIALDMLFLGADGTVIGIARNAQPYSHALIRIDAPVRAVLELNAGTADRIAVREGDRVCHPLFRRAGC